MRYMKYSNEKTFSPIPHWYMHCHAHHYQSRNVGGPYEPNIYAIEMSNHGTWAHAFTNINPNFLTISASIFSHPAWVAFQLLVTVTPSLISRRAKSLPISLSDSFTVNFAIPFPASWSDQLKYKSPSSVSRFAQRNIYFICTVFRAYGRKGDIWCATWKQMLEVAQREFEGPWHRLASRNLSQCCLASILKNRYKFYRYIFC